MSHWKLPDEALPGNVYAGDRIAIVVVEREHACAPLKPRLVMLTATENGWEADDETFAGYGKHDGMCWALERDLMADAVTPLVAAPSPNPE